jgi:hypothetical protein
VLRPRNSRWLAGVLVLLALALAVLGVTGEGGLPKWPIAMALAAAGGLAVRPWLPRWLDPLLFALPYAALPLVSLYALFGAIVPLLG